MSCVGDSNASFANDCKDEESLENIYPEEDSEIMPLKSLRNRYTKHLLNNAQKSFMFLQHQTLVDHVDADGEYIISAGKDHDINIWDAVEGRHIRRLSGHIAPVTGLAMFNSAESPSEKIIVSSSEDGSIRIWLLNKGEECFRIETGSLITCMGIINKSLAVTGNHKGYMEVRHLKSGNMYTTIHAHVDPVDALVVEGNHACTATFESPSCLKVWDIQFEQTMCIYHIENSDEIEFCCLAIWNTMAILGSTDQQKLHVINFKTDEKDVIDLERSSGKVLRVKVWNEWILSCSAHKRDVLLDVHRIHNYEHFGTFSSNMHLVNAIAAMEFDSSFKIVLGGSALAMLSFDFILTQEKSYFNRTNTSEKTSIIQNKEISHYTLKSTTVDEFNERKSSDSDDEAVPYNYYKSILSTVQPSLDKMQHNGKSENNEPESQKIPTEKQMLSVLTEGTLDASFMPADIRRRLPYTCNKDRMEEMLYSCTEGRVVIRKLEELLDKNKKTEEKEKFAETNEMEEEAIEDIKEEYLENTFEEKLDEDIIEEIDEPENDESKTEESVESVTETLILLNVNSNELLEKKTENIRNIQKEFEKNLKFSSKLSAKKNKKCKKAKKESQKSKHKTCQIM